MARSGPKGRRTLVVAHEPQELRLDLGLTHVEEINRVLLSEAVQLS